MWSVSQKGNCSLPQGSDPGEFVSGGSGVAAAGRRPEDNKSPPASAGPPHLGPGITTDDGMSQLDGAAVASRPSGFPFLVLEFFRQTIFQTVKSVGDRETC